MKRLIVAVLLLVAGSAGAGVPEGMIAWRAGEFARAIEQLAEAANGGDAEAQFLTGSSYASAQPPLRDIALAEAWLLKAAGQGYSQAYYGLANIYMFQSGARNEAKAVPWYRKAAMRGHPEGQFLLGMILFGSKTVPQDRTEAYMWLALAARGGSHLARHTMVKLLKDFTPDQIETGTARADAWKPVRKDPPAPPGR